MINQGFKTNGQDAGHIHTGWQGSVSNVSWTVVHVTSIYRCPGLWWSPPAPSSSPACNDLPRSGPQGTYHMSRARTRNSESCLSGNFLNWKQRGVYLALRKKKIKLLFSSLLGLKVVTTQRARAEERGHTLLSRATFSPNDSLFLVWTRAIYKLSWWWFGARGRQYLLNNAKLTGLWFFSVQSSYATDMITGSTLILKVEHNMPLILRAKFSSS